MSNNAIGKGKLQELVAQVDPRYTLDPEVEEVLLSVADEFIESVTTFSCALAKHRQSDTLEAKDIRLHLERNWNIKIPAAADEETEVKPSKKPPMTDIHRNRVNLVRRKANRSTKK
eukprot:gb/GECH01012743.1/.p1 GENE.gb/GECH01012743.1/~~gb/GECH01012743.1/.p1  ORF type:complete len:116 (+),score=33.46 gb/GECH01012743.1/:1-348(+)